MAAPSPSAAPLVREGDTVIFDTNGDKQALVRVDAKRWGAPCSRSAAVPGSRCRKCMRSNTPSRCNACTAPRPAVCSRVKLGSAFCPAAPLIGCPYGAMFTLAADGKSLQRCQ